MGNAPTDVPAALAGLSDQPRVRADSVIQR